jgi:chlorophyllide a reductase subunit Z
MDKVDPTPSRLNAPMPWHDDATAALDRAVGEQPVLIRISAAKRLRELAERSARKAGEELVTAERVERARVALAEGEPA